MKGERKKGYTWAISAGFNAALAAISAKFFSSQLKYVLVVLFNVIMWGCYVNSMKSLSSLQATVTNFATNFLTSGMSGYVLFDEALPLKQFFLNVKYHQSWVASMMFILFALILGTWFAGASLIVIGVIVLTKSSIENKTHTS